MTEWKVFKVRDDDDIREEAHPTEGEAEGFAVYHRCPLTAEQILEALRKAGLIK